MHYFKIVLFLISTVAVSSIPSLGYCQEDQTSLNLLMQSLREGKASLSMDKKNILDETGKIVAHQIPVPVKKSTSPADKTPPVCNQTCAIFENQCYADMTGSVVCINVCKKELFTCN